VSHDTATGFAGTPFGFAGGLFDQDTGLTHFAARDYDSESGTFNRIDPIGVDGGTNVYGYAAGDPVNRIDVSGNKPALPERQSGMSYYDPAVNMSTTPQSRGARTSIPDETAQQYLDRLRAGHGYSADHPAPFRESYAVTAACAASGVVYGGFALLGAGHVMKEELFEGFLGPIETHLEDAVSGVVSDRVQEVDDERVKRGLSPMNHEEYAREVWLQTLP